MKKNMEKHLYSILFLRKLTRICLSTLGRIAAWNLPKEPLDSEPIARFVFNSDELSFKEVNGMQVVRPKGKAFGPATKDNESSVYRVVDCDPPTVWKLGKWYCQFFRNDSKKIVAKVRVSATDVRREGLSFRHQPVPHKRHINIANWPLESSAKLQARNNLVVNAKCTLPPEGHV
jgi:hypothetical protein